MKKLLISTFICMNLLLIPSIYALAENYNSLPANYSEFKQRCQQVATSPEGAVKMYFDAVFSYMNPKKRAEANKMLRYIMRQPANWNRLASFGTFTSRLNNPAKHYIFRSFVIGTSPENGYTMSIDNYELDIAHVEADIDFQKVMLQSSGADNIRAVWVQEFDDGLWYVINNAATYVDVRAPKINDTRHDADYD